jgi:hypothetical protein
MPELFGHTRARIAPRHALLTPDNHVSSSVPGITGATVIVLINPAMGARFAQTLVTFQAGGRAHFAASEVETFGYVLAGEVSLTLGGKRQRSRTRRRVVGAEGRHPRDVLPEDVCAARKRRTATADRGQCQRRQGWAVPR